MEVSLPINQAFRRMDQNPHGRLSPSNAAIVAWYEGYPIVVGHPR